MYYEIEMNDNFIGCIVEPVVYEERNIPDDWDI